MPRIEKVYTLEVTPEKFLEACSPLELVEVKLLLSSGRFQYRTGNEIEYLNLLLVEKERTIQILMSKCKQNSFTENATSCTRPKNLNVP
jgi:hypothetical protein